LAVAALALGASVAHAQDATQGAAQDTTQNAAGAAQGQLAQQAQPAETSRTYGAAAPHSTQSRNPSGFNTGPTQSNVPGCVGPASFCNIYFGS
jgi:hypothetical protein